MRLLVRAALLAAFVAPSIAVAEDRPVGDRGRDLANDPYTTNGALTTGRMSGFRALYGDPDALAAALVPSTPATGRSDLLLVNDRMSWAEVAVGGQKVGVLGPYGKGLVQDVPAGDYAYTLTWPTGYAATLTARAEPPPAPPPAPDFPALPQDPPPSETPTGEAPPAP